MNCPYCDYYFKVLAANGDVTKDTVAPIVCESCGEIGLLDGGVTRTITLQELGWIKESPAYRDMILPVQQRIYAERRKRNAGRN